MYDRLELAQSCLHCYLRNELRQNQLRAEIETAVLLLSKRLNGSESGISISSRHTDLPIEFNNLSSADSPGEENLQIRAGTPDIVVSSFNSDDENDSYSLSSLEQMHKYETSISKNDLIIKQKNRTINEKNQEKKLRNDLFNQKTIFTTKPNGTNNEEVGEDDVFLSNPILFFKKPPPDVTISQVVENTEINKNNQHDNDYYLEVKTDHNKKKKKISAKFSLENNANKK